MNKIDIKWENMYLMTFQFINKYNYYPIYQKNKNDDINKIATWIQYQKNKYDKNQLINYKIEKLKKLPNWKWNNIIKKKELTYKEDENDPIEEFDEPQITKIYYPIIYDPIEEF